MKILIVGAGAQGSIIATETAKDPEVSEIRLSDIDLGKARQLAERLKSNKVRTLRVDASRIDDVTRAARDVNVIVNTTTWNLQFNLNIMEASLNVGSHYQDLASHPSEQLALNERWKEAGLTALIDTGVSPGFTNVLAAQAVDKLDRVEEIRIRLWGGVESKEPTSFWSPETAWRDMAVEPIVYKNGKYKEVSPFSGEEVYNFPEPVGPQTVFWHSHEEPETLPRFIGKGVKYVDFKMGGPEFPLAKAIVDLGLLDHKPIDVKGVEVVPRDVFLALVPPTPSMEEVERMIKAGIIDMKICCAVDVKGQKEGAEVRYVLYSNFIDIQELAKRMPGANPVAYITSVPASIFTKMLVNGRIKSRGVIPPEALEPTVRRAFIAELAEKGIRINEKMERLV
ncbi:MAG: saccharopine dehydrogenase NADP-binding domain-containing protein [Candidatus Bathyarchaeota archaeon]|nr:MAG: saccharopine dehydrogenase NADP-binding domain-containing protein [Candidatus Bathyarchaeota archaeon]